MDKGFFIVLVQCKGISADTGIKSAKHWKADLIDPMPGWVKSSGETINATIDYQKEQYDARIIMNQPVPDLVSINCGPMASGQTVRFVAVR